MTTSRKTAVDEAKASSEKSESPVKDTKTTTGAPASKGPAAAAPAPVPGRRKPPAAKEVIPFEWKLIGEAGGVSLTLFKAIERPEVEAQYERVKREGYYKKLRVIGLEENVPQPEDAKTRMPGFKRAQAKEKAAKKLAARAAATSSKAKSPKSVVTVKSKTITKAPKAAKVTKAAKSKKVAKAPKKKTKATKSVKKAQIKKKTSAKTVRKRAPAKSTKKKTAKKKKK